MTDLAPTPTASIDPHREYVAGGTWVGAYTAARALPWAIDDVTRDLGDDLYEQLLRDPQVSACMTVLKASILEDGATLTSAVPDKDGDGFAQAAELVRFSEHALDEMETALDDVLWNLCDALAFGNKVAEEVYHLDRTFSGRQQLTLRALKVKPRKATAFVVDAYWNVLGLYGVRPGVGFGIAPSTIGDPTQHPAFLPRAKFCVTTFRPIDSDPRGTSILRPAYNAWWLKMQTWPEYLKYLVQFASPSLWGTTAEDAADVTDPDTAETLTAEEAMLRTLIAARNGTAMVFPHGAQLNPLAVAGEGKAFLNAFDLYDRQITTAILTQTRATMEAENGSRADSETASDVLGTMVRQMKKSIQRALRRDVLRDLVRYNYGERLVSLTPNVTLGITEAEDVTALMTAIAGLQRVNYLDPSQFPAIDTRLNLPQRTPEELTRRQERAAAPPPAPVVTPAPMPTEKDPADETV